MRMGGSECSTTVRILTRLQRQAVTPSKFDPCLFLNNTIVLLVYVEDIDGCKSADRDPPPFIVSKGSESALTERCLSLASGPPSYTK